MAPMNVCVIIRGELAIGRIFAPHTSHEGGAVKARPYRCRAAIWTRSRIASSANVPETRRALPHQSGSRCLTGPPAEPQLLFRFINQSLLMLALWSCGRRAASSKRSGKSTGFCWPRAPRSNPWLEPISTAALMPTEPHIRSPFSERLAPQSLILEVIGLGRAGPHCMAAYHSHCLRRSARPDPTRLIRPRGTRDNDPAFLGGSVWLHDNTRRDLTMVDISREGDEQFPGERDNRDAADPAAFGANALAEPTAESTVGLVSHPHPGKLDHCGAQTWISCFRDTLVVVDATTLPWAGSQARIGCQLPSVLEVPEQTLKVEHGSELRANALEPHK